MWHPLYNLNTTLIKLNVADHGIEETGAQHLASAIQSNSTLISIYLEGNEIGEEGVQHLATVLQSSSTLISLGLGFHCSLGSNWEEGNHVDSASGTHLNLSGR